jgi:hypothetical protein
MFDPLVGLPKFFFSSKSKEAVSVPKKRPLSQLVTEKGRQPLRADKMKEAANGGGL